MATKGEEIDRFYKGLGCLGRANDNEPIFVLRGQDRLAPACVRLWADMLEVHANQHYTGKTRKAMVAKAQDARALAHRMEEWPTRKLPD